MGIRIRPKEIIISDDPKEDPFKNDLLNREESIEILTHIVGSIEGPCTMAVDAPWGAGKTTFIRLWHQYLVNNGFTVIRFNAWENDFYDDPFVALCAELSAGQDTGKDLLEAGGEIIKHVAWNVSGQIIAGLSAGTLNLSELAKAYETAIKERLKQYQDAKKEIKKFRGTLQAMATPDPAGKQQGPLIVMIDELDRCRPSYAVELLEVAKHLFSVDNIIFVLAINRSELAHSIRAIYGAGFNAEDYLHRFFDVDFQLPEPDREAFIDSLFNAIQLNDYFNRTGDRNAQKHAATARTLLQRFSRRFNFNLRQIEQSVHRLGLVFASLPSNKFSFFLAAMAALILRTINTQLYYDFINGKVSDLDVVDTVFNSTDEDRKRLQNTTQGRLFEAILITAFKEMRQEFNPELDFSSSLTPLEGRYKEKQREATEQPQPDGTGNTTDEHWYRVLEMVDGIREVTIRNSDRLGFIPSVKRLELVTGEMIDKGQE